MILIADSGSTKCDWALFNDNNELVFKTQTLGLNPNMLTTQMMHKRIARSAEIAHVSSSIKEIYFYGAGCGTSKNQIRLKRFLEKYFINSKSEVQEDIVGACRAVTQDPGIVCILGTGSNACYFDGEKCTVPNASLGYMIMDEASGNYFGKQLLKDYFYQKMPQEIARKFRANYDLSPHIIKNNLYKKDNPNVYLADLAKFIFLFDPLPSYFAKLFHKGLQEFIDNWVSVFPESKKEPIHFVGSLAYYAQDIIAEVLSKNNMKMGKVVKQPIDGLISYFENHLKAEGNLL